MYSKNYVSRKTKTPNNLEQRVHHKKYELPPSCIFVYMHHVVPQTGTETRDGPQCKRCSALSRAVSRMLR